jgi:hypothetical protein
MFQVKRRRPDGTEEIVKKVPKELEAQLLVDRLVRSGVDAWFTDENLEPQENNGTTRRQS